jgi:hypothetical protein
VVALQSKKITVTEVVYISKIFYHSQFRVLCYCCVPPHRFVCPCAISQEVWTGSGSSCTSPLVNRISGHDAQFLTVNSITIKVNLIPLKQWTRKINNETVAQFQHLLENEMWEPVFKNKDENCKLNSFLCIFLNIFEGCFQIQNKSVGRIKNDWIVWGRKLPCKHKRSLCVYTHWVNGFLQVSCPWI